MTYDDWKLDNGEPVSWDIYPHRDDEFDTEEEAELYRRLGQK